MLSMLIYRYTGSLYSGVLRVNIKSTGVARSAHLTYTNCVMVAAAAAAAAAIAAIAAAS